MKNNYQNQDNFVEFDPNIITGDFMTPVGSTGYTEVKGKLGKTRHAGIFSENNYYASLLPIATNNKDADALFERAVESEADLAKWKMEQDYARAVLLEQRSYDDPSAQISRERRAGINSDLIGGTGGSSAGGSSAQQAVPTMSDVTAQSKFKNAYDDTSEVFNGINTAVNVISSVSNFGTSIANSIVSLATIPSTITARNAQNSVVSNTADDLIAISGDKALRSNYDTLNAGVETIARLSGLVTPDSSDEDINAILGATGVSAENIGTYRDAVKYLHKNPKIIANHEENKKRQRELQEWNKTYTADVIGDMITQGKRIRQSQLDFNEDRISLQAKIASYLNTDTNAQNVSGAELQQNELRFKSIKRDLEVYVANIEQIAEEERRIDNLIKLYKEDVVAKRTPPFNKMTDADYLALDALRSQKAQLHALGSDELENLYGISRSAYSSYYLNKQNLNGIGEVEPLVGIQKHQNFVGYNYSTFVKGEVTRDEITGNLLSLIPVVGGIVQNAFDNTQIDKSVHINNYPLF